MQDGAVLGDVDLLAGEHRIAPGGDSPGLGQLDQKGQRMGVDVHLGEVERHLAERDGEFLEPLRVAVEERQQPPFARDARRLVEGEPDLVGHGGYLGNWLAVRARASTSSQRPSFSRAGATGQDPPTQSTFGRAR